MSTTNTTSISSSKPTLKNYKTGREIRPATIEETEASREAGAEGVILVRIGNEDVACFVEE